MQATNERTTADGILISASQVRRLEREVAQLKEEYDSLKIKSLTNSGVDQDQAKLKNEATKLEQLRKTIRTKEQTIIEVKLALK